ncbi:hypothetical protein V8E54_003608 [Elaphomyces granulatus]
MSSNQNVTEQYVSSIDEQPVIMDFTDDLVPFATAQPQVLSAQPERQMVQQEEEDPQRLIPLTPCSSEYSQKFFWNRMEKCTTDCNPLVGERSAS